MLSNATKKEINPARAFCWIVDILTRQNTPFAISGGLSARVYGSPRKLNDIDIEIPDACIDTIAAHVRPYIVYGPVRYKESGFDLLLMTLDYEGQLIDLSGADDCKIFDTPMPVDLKAAPRHEVFGLSVPVIAKEQLIAYKKRLSRDVDLEDIKWMTNVR